jgi:two-component system response regulator PilR (NtrC family)
MESELFGYRKGAFTGANEDRDGFFQAAHGGTLFLDEVAELPLHTQVLLLRAIQERRVRKVGSTQEEPADARIICATNQSLAGMVEAGRFRRDLYYRLNVVDLTMPPLRECREDIPLIAGHILQRLAAQNGVPAPRLSEAALAQLMAYDFPGNVRELENIMERALALSSQAPELGPEELALHRIAPDDEAGEEEPESQAPAQATGEALPTYLDRLEREAILQALGKTGFNRTAAARLLGITFRQLRYRMQRLSIKEEAR